MKTFVTSASALALAIVPSAVLAVTASDPGTSPNGTALEPYLITWLLPVAGILSGIAMIFVDRRTRTTP